MTWFDVLIEHWSELPADMQQNVREYHQLRSAAETVAAGAGAAA
jgi:hypothetical protein